MSKRKKSNLIYLSPSMYSIDCNTVFRNGMTEQEARKIALMEFEEQLGHISIDIPTYRDFKNPYGKAEFVTYKLRDFLRLQGGDR